MNIKKRKQSTKQKGSITYETGNKNLKTRLWAGLDLVEKVASIVAVAYAFIR